MFRRSQTDPADAAQPEEHTGATAYRGKKPVPTPKRRDAEAAARARAKQTAVPTGKGGSRAARVERGRTIRAAMKAGDERYLPQRDQGPVRRFVRDFVDSRLCLAELAIPLFFVSLVFSTAGQVRIGNSILYLAVLGIVVDTLVLRFLLRRQLRARFPDESTRGSTFYAFTRSMQVRFLRIPKPRVKLGQRLADRS